MKNQYVFIGSSSENIPVAQAIHNNLNGEKIKDDVIIETQIWSQSVFGIGDTTLETLREEIGKSDFAILVFGNDSTVIEREKYFQAARDNVVFELGLFIGVMGHKRCFIVKEKQVKIPSDLTGITYGTFTNPQSANLSSALSTATSNILKKIKEIYDKEPKSEHKQTLTDKYSSWWDKNNTGRNQKGSIHTLEGFELKVSPSTFSPDIRLTYSPVIVYKNLPPDLSGKKILDLGTGCGILAITAALRGAKDVLAIDIDRSALNDAKENVKLLEKQGVIPENIIEVRESDLFSNVKGKYDYILANLPISEDAESWKGLGDSVPAIIGNCVKGLNKHLKRNGHAIFAWASFGPRSMIPEMLEEEGFSCKRYFEDTFGATWYAYIAKKIKKR
ncbi:MAG: methyltransferase [Bacteroidetes bacterium]|nr:methyltransferase [Bacteroidota bacterium]